jgi:hypothetical protein
MLERAWTLVAILVCFLPVPFALFIPDIPSLFLNLCLLWFGLSTTNMTAAANLFTWRPFAIYHLQPFLGGEDSALATPWFRYAMSKKTSPRISFDPISSLTLKQPCYAFRR